MTGQIVVQQQAEDGDAIRLPNVSQSGIPNRGICQSEETRNVDHMQTKGTQERLAQVNRQRQHSDLTQLLSQVLTPVTRRLTLQRSLLQSRPHLISESISERHALPIRPAYHPKEIRPEAESSSVAAQQADMPFMASLPPVQSSGEVAVHSGRTIPTKTISVRPATLQSKALPDLRPNLSKLTIADEVVKRLDRPALQRTADKPDGPALSSPPSQEVTWGEGSRVYPYTLTPQPEVEAGQASMREPTISRSMSRRDMPSLDTGGGSSLDQSYAEGFPEKLLSYRHTPSITGSVIRPLPVIKSISRTMAMPSQQLFETAANMSISDKSKDYGFLQRREYVPSFPNYKYARQPSATLPVTSPARPKSESSIVYGEELFRHAADTVPELTHSGNHNGLELAMAPVGRAPETTVMAQAAAPEPQAEGSEEGQAAPDIRALAREIYPLIKRMIMIERDRHPTWY
jgi:hypothetical protein